MTGAGVLVGLLLGVALVVPTRTRRGLSEIARTTAGTGRGAVPDRGASWPRPDGAARPEGTARPAGAARPWRRRSGRWCGQRDDEEGGGLAAVLVEVASLVRAGAAPADAWSLALGAPVPDRVPTVDQVAAARARTATRNPTRNPTRTVSRLRTGAPTAGHGVESRGRGSPGPPLEAVVAAARVADELGAPLAAVLDQVAGAIAAQEEADADVEAALAGPRSSARVLAWLPLLGVLLGTALGADPAGVLLGGGLGTASGVVGGVLVLVGRWWTGALVRRVARAGSLA